MTGTTPCSQCGTLVPTDVEFCPNCNFYMSWAKDPEDEESAALSPRLPDEEAALEPAPPPEPLVETGDPCEQCGTPNAPARVYCRRCGHDLRAPAAAPVPEPVDDHRPWLIPVVIGAGILLLIVLWAVVFRDGSDSATSETSSAPLETTATTETTDPPPSTEGETTAAPLIEALPAGQISASASSSLSDEAYSPAKMLDGALDTAWNHCGTGCDQTGDARQGVGVTLTFDFAREVTLTGFRIANGYQKESETIGDVWLKNNRIRQAVLTTDGGTQTVELVDERGFQSIEIAPVATESLTIEVTAVYEGDGTYNDLGISEIEFLIQAG
ncbi:MAG: hypothetical protein GY722_01280 [bacterium]|nr:hypothetical protein [bacterium]